MILVVGDVMVDEYLFGEVERISPEAPVAVLKTDRCEVREGAAANVAANVRAMGAVCHLEGSRGSPQVKKMRLIGRNQQMLRVDFDFPQNPVKTLPVGSYRIVIFSDYGKGTLANVSSLIPEAKERGMTVLVDPKGYDYAKYRGADLIKPNRDEMRAMVGGWKNEEELAVKAQKIREEAGIGALLLTRAAEGMTLFDKDGRFHVETEAKELFDVTGAGDTAIAALAVALHRGEDISDGVYYANKAAGIACGRFGTAIVNEGEVFS